MSRAGLVYFRVSITRFNDAPRIIPRISENELKLYLSRATHMRGYPVRSAKI